MSSVSTRTKSQPQKPRMAQQVGHVRRISKSEVRDMSVHMMRRRRGCCQTHRRDMVLEPCRAGKVVNDQYKVSSKEATATCVLYKTMVDIARVAANSDGANRCNDPFCPIKPSSACFLFVLTRQLSAVRRPTSTALAKVAPSPGKDSPPDQRKVCVLTLSPKCLAILWRKRILSAVASGVGSSG